MFSTSSPRRTSNKSHTEPITHIDHTTNTIANQPGCEVRSFDPSMASPRHWRAPRHLFEPVGIGPASGLHTGASTLYGGAANYAVASLADLMEQNNHTRLSVVRMDVESAEWDVLEQWLEDGLFDRIDQLIVEVHLWRDILQGPKASTREAARFARILQALPMALFTARRNIYDGNFILLDQLTRIYELGFLRV